MKPTPVDERKDAVEDAYALTPLQEGILFHVLAAPDSGVYLSQAVFTLEGPDPEAFAAAWQRVVDRHPILRTAFAWQATERPLQVVGREVRLPFEVLDWRGEGPAETQERLRSFLLADRKRGFNLSRAPMLRVAFIRQDATRGLLVWTFHHLLLDGWSVALVLKEMVDTYEALRAGRELALPAARPYREYIHWLSRQDPAQAEAFWKRRLGGFVSPTRLDLGRPASPPPAGESFDRRVAQLSAGESEGLLALARRGQVTLNTLFQGAWAMALSRLSGEDDVVFGNTLSGRPADLPGVESMIGLFINTLPTRVFVRSSEPLLPFLRRLQDEYAELRQFEWSPLVSVQGWSDVPRGVALFETLFAFENYPMPDLGVARAGAAAGPGPWATGGVFLDNSHYPFSLAVRPDRHMSLHALFDRERFDPGAVDRLLARLQTLLAGMVAAPEGRVGALPFLTDAERRRSVLLGAPGEGVTGPKAPREAPCVMELFRESARRDPGQAAVVDEEGSVSFADLDLQSDHLARMLLARGVGPDDVVGVCAPRSSGLVASVLGVVKAGAAYLPLDPAHPAERKRLMLEDARVQVVVCAPGEADAVRGAGRTLVVLEGGRVPLGSQAKDRPLPQASVPDALAYVIYTSGSTGRPKGVEVPHRGLANLVAWHVEAYGLQGGDRCTLVASPAFDASVWEVWPALAAGATLHVPDDDTRRTASRLAEWLKDRAITHCFLPTPLAEAVLEEPGAGQIPLRALLTGGDRLHRRAGESLPFRLVNHYGPTENAVVATCADVRRDQPFDPPIGLPIPGTAGYVLDGELRFVPEGVPGELFLGGVAVARGYRGRSDFTGERFLPDPFTSAPGGRMYRTGDRVRVLADGNLEFLGRVDEQVKLQGHRIEPGEVEAALAGLPCVREAAVVARKSAGDAWRLVGYVSLRDGHDFDPRALRAELLHTLPEYMVPAVFVPLDRLPLSASGKVDRRALPEPPDEAASPGGNDGAPRNALEAGLAEIWSRVLSRPVSIHDGFFALGGHSLLATRVMSQVRRTYGVDLPLRALFEAGSVAELARRIEDARREPGRTLAPALVASAREGDIPLSFAQQRLWFLDRMGAGAAYNIPWALRLRGALDVEALRGALTGLARRHEALRTTFPEVAGRAVQRVSEDALFPMRETDLGALPALDREREARRLASEEASRPFDLAQGPLVRACLLRLADLDHVLLVSIHHILADGWSMGVLTRELAALYREGCPGGPAANLPPLPVQYADFARWQRGWLQGSALAEQVAYWRKHLGDEPPRLDLPLDRPRPREQSFRGGRHLVILPEELSKRLATLCRQEGVTLFMALLAGWSAVLARWSGQDEVVVGTPIANRNRAEIEGLIGFFVNSLVLRTSLRGDPSFRDLLGRVKDAALGAYDHQDLPFEKLVEELHPGRNLDRNPLFQVVFAVQNAPFEALELPGLVLEAFERELGTSRFDLETHVFEQRGRQAALFNYNADLFDAATIERLAAHWLSLLGAALAQPAARVLSLPLVAANDRALLAELGRGPRPAVAEESTVAAAFAAQAALTPDAVAARFDGRGITYAELDQRSRRVARLLRNEGAGPGALVGICLERSFDLLAGLLGILRSGAAYLPLDPDYPKDRLAFMVEDARPEVLLVEARHAGLLPAGGIPLVVLEGDSADLMEGEDLFADAPGSGDDLAYVTYTSGSTGRPKGVEVTQRGVIRLVKGADYAAFGPEETVLHLAPVSFDASTFEIWGPLLNGGTVVLFPERVPTPRDLGELIRREGVTTMWLTASLFNVIVDEEPDVLRPLRQLLIGGEALSVPHVRRAQERLPHTKIINGYGPTENTTFTCCHPIAPLGAEARAVPIGRPIARTDVYVVEDHGALCPAGVPGELLIGGEGLARGYLGRPDLTAERFVPDPFGTRPGARLYRTGDRVRWQTSGALEFLGRRDHQVKLRGFRIELGEIQAVLAGHADVGEAAVIVREGGSAHERRLVAFVVPASAAPKPGPQPGAPGGEVEDRIAQWREVYDSVIYGQLDAAGADPTLNLSGWNSTYTGEAIPEAEMREQVDQAVARIQATAPRRVLEIGCGTGLLLARIAPSCSRYVATDFSASALAHVRAVAQGLPGDGAQVEVLDRRADDFSGFEPGDFDVVVLNSIVQYFPDAAYLRLVLEGSLRVLAPGGRVFVGDVRHLPLLETFAASVAAHEAGAMVSREWLREKTRERLASEQELVVSPHFFAAFAAQAPRDVAVHVTPKRGRAHNELTRYRYDVILEAGLPAAPAPMTWLDWDEDDLSLPELRRLLSETGAERLGVRGVPNARTWGHGLLARWLAGGEEEAPPSPDVKGGVDPEDLWALSVDLPYEVDLSLAAGLPEGRFDVMLRRRPLRETLPPFEPAPLDPAAPDTNDPLTSTRVRGLVPQLRRHLQERLPEYMVPSAFVLLEALPLGPNGKVDVSALQRHEVATPQSEVSFEEPGTPLEAELARVFADVLGLSRVGALDNFFDLGGDSILAIQIVARANQAGIRLTPKQIFQAQTVSALARVAGRVEVTEAEQGLLTGRVPLTPIQAWYFEVPRLEVNHFNQSILLECAERLDAALLEAVAGDLEAQHDGLRSRYELVAGAWHQVIAKEGGGAFVRMDLSEAPLGGEAAAVAHAAEQLQRSLDLARGPIWRLALLDLGPSRAARLLVVGHHLVVDGVSWRTLMEDLDAACSARRRELPVRLPPKTTSFRHWAQSLRRLAETPQIQAELPFWQGVGEGGATPLGASAPSAEATRTLGASASLRPDETRELLQDVPRVYHTQVVDALAYALVRAFSEVTGGRELLVDFEGHGREDVIAGVDLSRTVGWFTTLYPVRLRHEAGAGPGAGLMAVKERLRAIPGKGLGYGLLRYLDDSAGPLLAALPQSEVSFNYLGQFDQAFSRLQLFRRSAEGAGSARAEGEARRHPVEIGAAVVDGVLSVTFTAPARHPGSERLEAWAAAFVAALRALLEHCRRPDAGGHTPSDFPLAGVDQATLDRILAGARDVENVYPLSPMQEGMLFHSLLEEGGSVYTERLRLEIHGRLDPERLARAWQHAVDRHGALRTRFVWEGLSRHLQVVERHARLPFALVDLRHETPASVRERLDEMLHQPGAALDPARAPLTRITLVRTGDEVQHLVWEFHHMVLDGWCLSLVLKDAADAYAALDRGGPLPSATLPTPYGDYVAWLLDQDLAKAEEYWRKQLGGFASATPLPRDARPGASPTAEAEARVRSFHLSAGATAELRALGRRLRVTLSTIVEAAWAVVLSRWSGERDVTFGVNVSGRPAALPGVESMVGLFVNTLPLRVRVPDAQPLSDWLLALQEHQVEQRHFEWSPLVKVQAWAGLRGGQPLFESLLAFENYPVKKEAFSLGSVAGVEYHGRTNYPLSLIVGPGPRLHLRVTHDPTRFDVTAMDAIERALVSVLEGMPARVERPVAELRAVGKDEEDATLALGAGPARAWGAAALTLHGLFEAQVDRTPDAEAVRFEGRTCTYRELDAAANRLAHRLLALGVRAETRVGLFAARSLEMVVGLLGILKAGGAYVPLEPEYPRARLGAMCEDAGVTALVVQEGAGWDPGPGRAVPTLSIGPGILLEGGQAEAARPGVEVDGRNLAYVIFTSGSTGRPKGAMNEHAAVMNRILWMQDEYRLGDQDAVLQKTPFGFDVSVWEFFCPLAVGARLVVARPEGHRDPAYLARLIEDEGVTTTHFVPSMLRAFLAEPSLGRLPGLRLVVCSGEALPFDLQEAAFERLDAELHNLYGPTEAAVEVTHWACRRGDARGIVPIGRAIANTRVVVLDSGLRPVPAGASGELFLGGCQVGRGYVGRPDLTAERFLPDPSPDRPGERLYRTGDRVRMLPDGALEYLGRLDHQVKIRGHRVELGEIEAELIKVPGVSDCVVVAREDPPGSTRLVAYVVGDAEISEARASLKRVLPEAMVPSAFVVLPALPLGPNGKLDRKALPAPSGGALEAAFFEAPRTTAEATIARIWREVLGLEQVGIRDNFFDVGGHSLSLLEVHARLKVAFPESGLRVVDLFRYSTVEAVAERLAGGSAANDGTEPDRRAGRDAGRERLALRRARRAAGSEGQ